MRLIWSLEFGYILAACAKPYHGFPNGSQLERRIAHELKSGVTRPIVGGLSLVLVVGCAAEFLTRYGLRQMRSEKRPSLDGDSQRLSALRRSSYSRSQRSPLLRTPIGRAAWKGGCAACHRMDRRSFAERRRFGGNGTEIHGQWRGRGRAGAPALEVTLFSYRRSMFFIYAMAFTWAVVDMMQALALPPMSEI